MREAAIGLKKMWLLATPCALAIGRSPYIEGVRNVD